jgi:hypothetical protein
MSASIAALDSVPSADYAGYKPIDLGAGLVLLVRDDHVSTHPEDIAAQVTRQCRFIALGREGVRARIKECIVELARIDEEHDGNHPGLAELSESFGWTSISTAHTTDDYRKALTALVDTLSDDYLAYVLEDSECQIELANKQDDEVIQ